MHGADCLLGSELTRWLSIYLPLVTITPKHIELFIHVVGGCFIIDSDIVKFDVVA